MTPRLAIIGLDSSHCIEFTRILHTQQLAQVVTALRFPSAFQDEAGQDARAAQLEAYGVKVTTDIDEAAAGCDALMLLINDPSLHPEWGLRCSEYGLPMFIDKPFAHDLTSGKTLADHLIHRGIRVMSASSLRSAPELVEAVRTVETPQRVWIYGPLGAAPAGSSIIWYGVHAFEMLHKALGTSADLIGCVTDTQGVVAVLESGNGRRGVVELTHHSYQYGGCLRGSSRTAHFTCAVETAYLAQMRDLVAFLQGREPQGTIDSALSVLQMLERLDRQLASVDPADQPRT